MSDAGLVPGGELGLFIFHRPANKMILAREYFPKYNQADFLCINSNFYCASKRQDYNN